MITCIKYCFIAFVIGLLLTIPARAQNSVLGTGQWFKLAVEKDGVYKINYSLLQRMGVNPAQINPKTIKIYGNAGGMLPQSNAAPRPVDLTEISIHVQGEDDGIFHSNDFILFYAQGPDYAKFNIAKNIFHIERNLYSNKNYYFLTISEDTGKRISIKENTNGDFPIVDEFDDFIHHEVDLTNELKSGREWFGESFDIVTERVLRFDASGILDNTPLRVVSDVMAKSYTGASFQLSFNNTIIANQAVLPIPNSEYGIKGRHQRDTIALNSTSVSASSRITQEIKYRYNKNGTGYSIGYLDFLLLSYKRRLSLYGHQTIFQSSLSIQNPITQFRIHTTNLTASVWDITSPSDPQIQTFSTEQEAITFATESSQLQKFIVFTNTIPTPEFIEQIFNQNIRSITTPQLLIVTTSSFKEEALRLAAHRQQHTGLNVAVVTTGEIYNEFSSGRQDVTAIRDFVKHLYDKDPSVLQSLLLFGRSSYDYKDRLHNNTNFVPTYESRNSLHPLETYSSDDYYGFLENHEGIWEENFTEEHTLDIGIGRLTVKSLEEAKSIVDKIIYYDTHPITFGNWRKDIVFIADDGDFNEHQRQADLLAKFVDASSPEYNTRKIYLDAFQQILQPGGENAPGANQAITEAIDKGSLIINYTGHGGVKLLAQERIFDDFAIAALSNKTYPFFVTATCQFGRHDDPSQISGAELCILRPNGGGIGIVTSARPVNSSTNFELNKAFYEALLEKNELGGALTLGEIFRRTKNNSVNGVANRNFSLLADPSMTLAFPKLKIRISEIITPSAPDTLKALSRIKVKGEVVFENEEKATFFSGIAHVTLYDKETNFITHGNENPPFAFSQWFNALFRGKAEVNNGDFEFEFIVPKNIAYQPGQGKISLYAFDPVNYIDASGADLDMVIGYSEKDVIQDNTPPEIHLYLGDNSFKNGGVTNPNTVLIANLFDISGINISSYGIGNSIVAMIDGQQTYILNDFYEADTGEFTSGWIHFPLNNLTPGRHTLTVKAWDVYNNPSEASIEFIVTDGESLVIESFSNYPNPFQENTTLFFRHNRSGDDLFIQVSIYDLAGQLLKMTEKTIYSSRHKEDLLEINVQQDFEKKLSPGLYLARLVVRSLTNGSKKEQVTKLIIVN